MDYSVRRRVTFIFIVFVLIFAGVIAKLAYTILIEGDELRAVVQSDKNLSYTISGERGRIYDRNGILLAYSDIRYKVSIKLIDMPKSQIRDDNMTNPGNPYNDLVEVIAPLLEMSEDEIYTKLEEAEELGGVFIKYVDDQKIAQRLRMTWNKLLWVDPEAERKYPNNAMASDVLGYTIYTDDKKDVVGKHGIELAFEDYLKAQEGVYSAEVDRNRIELAYTNPMYIPSVDGHDVYLTIDAVLQYHVEESLKKAFEEHDPLAAHGLVLNVKTGEVLAMASYPNFLPETRRANLEPDAREAYGVRIEEEGTMIDSYVYTNNWIQSRYELGSPIKLLTAALALENDRYTLDTPFADMNSINVDGVTIKCWYHPNIHRGMTLRGAIAESHNPAFVEMGLDMGRDIIYEGFKDFGLYDRTGIELPYEQISNAFSYDLLENRVNLATTTFGQGSAYTPIQAALALASLVNGGELMAPEIVRYIQDAEGNTSHEASPTIVRSVISDVTSQQIREAMTYTVENGSGIAAKIEGLSVGGKTGTSQLLNPAGGYYEDRAMASFVAVAPMEDPEFLVYVLVEDPLDSIYGSRVCGPVAKEIMENIAEFYGLYRYDDDVEMIEVPSLIGLSVKETNEILEELGLYGKVQTARQYSEESIITVQFPSAGSLIPVGRTIFLEVMLD